MGALPEVGTLGAAEIVAGRTADGSEQVLRAAARKSRTATRVLRRRIRLAGKGDANAFARSAWSDTDVR
jgi:hypothetical protein